MTDRPRVTIEDKGYELDIHIRPVWDWQTYGNTLRFGLWILVMLVVAYLSVNYLLAGPSEGKSPREHLLSFVALMLLVTLRAAFSGYSILLFTRWLLHGERVYVSTSGLVLEGQPHLRSRIEVPLSEVRDLRIEPVVPRRKSNDHLTTGTVRLSAGKRKLSFGRRLSVEDAQGILDTIMARYGRDLTAAMPEAARS